MVIFDGNKHAGEKMIQLKKRADEIKLSGGQPKIAAIFYTQDAGSRLYTSIKAGFASEIGIIYEAHQFDLAGGVETVLALIRQLNQDDKVTGIILQKPTRKTWVLANRIEGKVKDIHKAYDLWWHLQTNLIDPKKDVDGLHPSILELLREGKFEGSGRVMPATAKAVLEILQVANIDLSSSKISILGKSDLLGLPLFNLFLSKNYHVELLGRKDLEARVEGGEKLHDNDIVISATGVANLITADLIKDGAVVIDVGEPKGDVDFENVKQKASFITPVPGGVGPMTVVCLMENCLDLQNFQSVIQ